MKARISQSPQAFQGVEVQFQNRGFAPLLFLEWLSRQGTTSVSIATGDKNFTVMFPGKVNAKELCKELVAYINANS